jgi:acetylornithine deacetylase/succinyl-diaminopimelate desuccinylase-like protein
VIQSGVKVNVIPSTCVFEADIRLPVGFKRDTVLDYMSGVLVPWPGMTCLVEEAASNPPSLSLRNHLFLSVITDTVESVTERRPTLLVNLDGTDCKFYRQHYVPVFVLGLSPRGMGVQSEVLLIDQYLAVIKTYTLTVFRYLWNGKEPINDSLVS